MTDPAAGLSVSEATRFSCRFTPRRSLVEVENEADIAAVWAEAVAKKPRMFDGRVLLAERAETRDGAFEAEFREVGFSTLVWLRARRFERPPLLNVFGAAVVVSADGAILLGRMADHTANAGRLYFPCGTPDLSDVRDGSVDLDGSIMRELQEETGLAAPIVEATERRLVVRDRSIVACLRVVVCAFGAQELESRVWSFLRSGSDGELETIAFVRGVRELRSSSPPFVHAAVAALLSRDG